MKQQSQSRVGSKKGKVSRRTPGGLAATSGKFVTKDIRSKSGRLVGTAMPKSGQLTYLSPKDSGSLKGRGTLQGSKVGADSGGEVLKIRRRFGMTRAEFHRLSGFSERALANWEKGTHVPDEATWRRLREMDKLAEGLSRVIQREAVPGWLGTPNEAFDGLKPLEVIERGDSYRLWQMIFALESGMLS